MEPRPLDFILEWTAPHPPRRIWFDMLGATGDSGLYKNLLQHVIESESGSCSVPLGNYAVGTVVRVRFSVKAFTDVPYILAKVAQSGLPHTRVAPDGSEPKTLAVKDRWTVEFKYTML